MKSMMMKSNLSLAVVALCAAGVIGSPAALAGDTATVNVSATVVGNCKVNSGGAVSFTLDPALAGDVAGSVTQPAFWCTKSTTYGISDDDGLNESGPGARRMRLGATAEYIPYSFTYTNAGAGLGKGTAITMDVASTVLNANFINATAGSYTDTVILSITP